MKITVQLIVTRERRTWEARCGLRLGEGESQVEALGRLILSLAMVDDVELVQLEALDLVRKRKAVQR
jgi:hypothetical protein